MNRLCYQFLARSGLAMKQYCRIGRCDNGDLFQHFVQGVALADDIIEIVLGPDFRFEVKAFLVVERLCQEICCACFESAHCHWDVAVPGEEYDGDLNTRFGKLLLQVESAY